MDWSHREVGESDRTALVCLHGFLGRGANWQGLATRLQHRWRCVLFDLPGHGESHRALPESTLTFPLLADQLLENLDGLTIQSCMIAGYSLGGRLALNFALCHPERVKALILESASPGLEIEPEREARRNSDELFANRLLETDMAQFSENWYTLPLFKSLSSRPELLREVVASASSNDANSMARVLSELSPGRMENLWPKLSELKMRVLLLAGGQDLKYVNLMQRAAGLIENSEFHVIHNAGHNIHLEAPAEFADLVSDFLSRL